MIKIDLITGFLGSGKTTFLKRYVNFLKEEGYHVGVIVNDYGGVNVDRLLIQELEDTHCEIEQVVGSNIISDWKRRFTTKLIAMKMRGINYVVVEPSGIYDIENFKDVINDEPISDFYTLNNVFSIVNPKTIINTQEEIKPMLLSQIVTSGKILFSHINCVNDVDISLARSYIQEQYNSLNIDVDLDKKIIIKEWSKLTNEDYLQLMNSGCNLCSNIFISSSLKNSFSSIYLLGLSLTKEKIEHIIRLLFTTTTFGTIYRIKGFYFDNNNWYEVNSTSMDETYSQIEIGQDVLILIGKDLDEVKIKAAINGF